MKMRWMCGILLAVVAAGPEAFAMRAAPPAARSVQGQGYLGVDLRDVSEDEVVPLKLKDTRGAEVVLVDHDAPAGRAGLREHDVVLQMNGQPIVSQDQIRRMLHDCPAGRTVALLISRDGQQMTLTARLSTREEVEREAWAQHVTLSEPQDASGFGDSTSGPSLAASSSPSPVHAGNSFIGSILMNSSYTGAMLEQMSQQLAQFFGVNSGSGLLVRSVVDNSPAAMAGMRAGDVVIRANERTIATTGDWAKVIKSSHGKPLSVVVLREKQEHTLTLTPDAHHRSSLEDLFAAPEHTALAVLNRSWLPKL